MHTSRSLLLALSAVTTLALAACSDDSVDTPDPDDETPPAADPAPFGLPQLADLPTDSFSFLKPGGQTLCAGGGEYGFAIRRGDPRKIVIEFEGGGACWNNATCNLPASKGANAVYKDFVSEGDYAGKQPGLRAQRDDNPVDGWTHVIVPYCSADVHWGDSTTEYPTVKVEHRGKPNTDAVLQYVYSQLKAPKNLFVTGCSAGGYGSIYWTPAIRAHYTKSRIAHMSDAAAGVIPPSFFTEAQKSWGLAKTFPTSVGKASEFTNLPYLYKGIGATYPEVRLSQFNVENDSTQKTFFMLMGGSSGEWRANMLESTGELASALPSNYRNYIGPGEQHCIIVDDSMYATNISGTSLTDWIDDLVDDDDDIPANVACPSCTK